MSQGITVIDSAGNNLSTTDYGITIYTSFLITSGTTGSVAYPELAGYTVNAASYRIEQGAGRTGATAWVTYPGGIPTVSWGILEQGYFGAATERLYVYVS